MYVIPTLLFVLGAAAGGAYGFLSGFQAWDFTVALGIGGFAGSAAGGIAFAGLYMTAPDDEPENGPAAKPSSPAEKPGAFLIAPSRSVPAAELPGPPVRTVPAAPAATLPVPPARKSPAVPIRETDRQKIRRLEAEIRHLKEPRRNRQ
jgi:hypothetical protein